MNSDYGKINKEYLVKTKTLRHLFVIDFKENVFDDAMTTASILLLANDNNNSEIHISTIDSKSDLQLIKRYIDSYPKGKGEFSFAPKDLDPTIKWRKYYQVQNSINYNNLVPFSTYAKVVRALLQGQMNISHLNLQRQKSSIFQKQNLLPCICKAKDAKTNFLPVNISKILSKKTN